MEISDIRIRKTREEGKLKALVSLTIDEAVAIHDIKLIQGEERVFVAMPSRRDENGVFRDIVHPINAEARRIIEEKIFEVYDEFLKNLEDGASIQAARLNGNCGYAEC